MTRSRFFQGSLLISLFCLGVACTQLTPSKTEKAEITAELSQDTAMHLLRSTVRINTDSATGTGVIICSQRRSTPLDPRYYSYILTCAHVVEDTINNPTIETFYYLDNNTIVAHATFSADIIAIDTSLDVAVLQVLSPKSLQDHIQILPTENFYDHRLFGPVYVAGCGLGLEPFITCGNISSFKVDHQVGEQMALDALRMTAATIYGNSGGGVYNSQGLLMGLAQSIELIHGVYPYEHAAYAIPIWSIALFLQENHSGFTIGVDTNTVDESMAYHNRKLRRSEVEAQEQDFRKALLDALEKLNNISPVNSISINISPIISNIATIDSAVPTTPTTPAKPEKSELPKHESPERRID